MDRIEVKAGGRAKRPNEKGTRWSSHIENPIPSKFKIDKERKKQTNKQSTTTTKPKQNNKI